MHELSIAQAIVEQAVEASRQAGATTITAVRVRIGALSGIAIEALQSAWDLATDGTPLADSRLDCDLVAVSLYCENCREIVMPSESWRLVCPHCQRASADVRAGRELQLEWLESP